MDLPVDSWELICKLIDEDEYRFLESVSLVSKFFLLITNRVRSTFVITDRTLPLLHKHLLRFRNLKRIKFLRSIKDLDSILEHVSRSGLDLESVDVSNIPKFPGFVNSGLKMVMSNVKELNCSQVRGLSDSDLISIGVNFPFIQNLDISYLSSDPTQVSDSGVIGLSLGLKGLLKINISGNSFFTDKSLVALSKNCTLLREVIFRECDFISSNCIKFVLHNSKNLESLAINGIGLKPRESVPIDAFIFAHGLTELDLSDSFLQDGLLCLIADANLRLKKLVLSNCLGLTFDGIWYFLDKCQTLLHLNLKESHFLTDKMIMELVMSFRRLTYLNLSLCFKLTGVAFFCIIERCLSLKCLIMEGTNIGVEEYSKELDIKSRMKYLYLNRNRNLRDECLNKISYHCPFVETLDVAECRSITGDGIREALRNCSKLRSLDISRCTGILSLGNVDLEFPKLESLRACGTWITDEALYTISKSCRGLMHLDLRGCVSVTSKGVKDVVQRCRRLREINVKYCEVYDGLITWMVSANPSLRKIIPPCGFSPTKNLQNFLLLHGCVICEDSSEMHSISYRSNGRYGEPLTKLIV